MNRKRKFILYNKFFIIFIIILIGIYIFTPLCFEFPGVIRLNIIIFGVLGLFLLSLYAYTPITETGRKAFKYYCFTMIALFVIVFIHTFSPPMPLSDMEKEYLKHFNSGNSYHTLAEYDKALNEYTLAENIYKEDFKLYIEKAYLYKRQNEYTKAIENAKEAMKYSKHKSIYMKSHNFKFWDYWSNNDVIIEAYNIIGKCEYKLERYKEAKEAYSFIIGHVTYEDPDAYLMRGICEYYLNNKQAALNNFEKYLKIVHEKINSDTYRDLYSNKDIARGEKWIDAANKL